MEKETKWIYFRESLFQSILGDLFMFSTLCGAMAMNHFYFGDSGVWAVILFAMVLIASVGRVSRKKETFTSKEELRKYINETL